MGDERTKARHAMKIPFILSFLTKGVKKWTKKCDDALKHQETISVKAWVKAMDSRITSLGGEGVQRFLGNLFRAFDGLFESSSLPAKAAGKAVTVMQRVRQIKAVSCSLKGFGYKTIFLVHLSAITANSKTHDGLCRTRY